MPRQENETEEIKGMIGGLVLLALVCTVVIALARVNSQVSEDAATRPSVSLKEVRSD